MLIMHRVPKYTLATLNKWLHEGTPSQTARIFAYYADRTSMILELLEEAEVVTKTA